MTARVVARWALLGTMCLIMFLLGQQSTQPRASEPPTVTVIRYQINGSTWVVPCVLPKWPDGQVTCDWDGATRIGTTTEGEHDA